MSCTPSFNYLKSEKTRARDHHMSPDQQTIDLSFRKELPVVTTPLGRAGVLPRDGDDGDGDDVGRRNSIPRMFGGSTGLVRELP